MDQEFLTFLRQTGKFPEVLESPHQFARTLIGDYLRKKNFQPESDPQSADEQA
jgi:hypothetical protein